MGSILRPVGPLPPAVYWRRRVLMLGVPLAIAGLMAYSWSSGSAAPTVKSASTLPPRPAPTPSPTLTPTRRITPGPQPTQRVAPPIQYPNSGPTGALTATDTGGVGTGQNAGSGGSGAGRCALTVTIGTDKSDAAGTPDYTAGQDPVLTVTLQDDGGANCVISAGGLVVTVAQVGTDGTPQPVWTNAACQGSPSNALVIGSGQSVPLPFTWPRDVTVSALGCPSAPAAAPNGVYQAVAAAIGVTSAPVRLKLS